MKVGIRELRRNLKELLARVELGEEVEVMRRGRAVARLTPAQTETKRLSSMAEFRESVHLRGAPLSEEIVEGRSASRF